MTVFQDDLDYQHYLSLLKHYKSRFQVKILAYCLMPNHSHLLTEITKVNTLHKFMHGLNLAYSQHYKSRYPWQGHLWQDRYKSYLIEKEKYLLTCMEYIEANPVKAKLVLNAEDYVWCSARERTAGSFSGLLDLEGTN